MGGLCVSQIDRLTVVSRAEVRGPVVEAKGDCGGEGGGAVRCVGQGKEEMREGEGGRVSLIGCDGG